MSSGLAQARRRTDAVPDEDRDFVKGVGAACFLGACCWALLFLLV